MFPISSHLLPDEDVPRDARRRSGDAERASGAGRDRLHVPAVYLDALAERGGWMLWLGSARRGADAVRRLEARGGIVWTLDPDLSSARWARPDRHRIGPAWEADRTFASLRFAALIADGLFDDGRISRERRQASLAAMRRLLAPSGRLLLGWDPRRATDPLATVEPLGLEPRPLAGRPARAMLGGRVYVSLVRVD